MAQHSQRTKGKRLGRAKRQVDTLPVRIWDFTLPIGQAKGYQISVISYWQAINCIQGWGRSLYVVVSSLTIWSISIISNFEFKICVKWFWKTCRFILNNACSLFGGSIHTLWDLSDDVQHKPHFELLFQNICVKCFRKICIISWFYES